MLFRELAQAKMNLVASEMERLQTKYEAFKAAYDAVSDMDVDTASRTELNAAFNKLFAAIQPLYPQGQALPALAADVFSMAAYVNSNRDHQDTTAHNAQEAEKTRQKRAADYAAKEAQEEARKQRLRQGLLV